MDPPRMMESPDLTQQPIRHVEATPDGGYALRILQAYRANCDCRYKVEGSVDSDVWDTVNEHQEQRAAELDKAIAVLKAESPLAQSVPVYSRPYPVGDCLEAASGGVLSFRNDPGEDIYGGSD